MKKSVFALGFLFSFVVSLSGCNKSVEIKDGKVPPEFMPFVENYLGSYEGQFDKNFNSLELSMQEDRLVLTPTADLLGSGCKSLVGFLKKLRYEKKSDQIKEVTEAEFAFDPGLCASYAEGRTLFIEGKKSQSEIARLDAKLLKEVKEYQRWVPGQTHCYNNNGHVECHTSPGRWETDYEWIYYQGNFVKK